MTVRALGREDLDEMGCGIDGCSHGNHDGLFLHGRCHMGQGNEVEYKNGVLHVRCRICKKAILSVNVADTSVLI